MRSADSHVFFHPTLVRVWMDTYSPIRKLSSIPIEARSTSGNSLLIENPSVTYKAKKSIVYFKSSIMKQFTPETILEIGVEPLAPLYSVASYQKRLDYEEGCHHRRCHS